MEREQTTIRLPLELKEKLKKLINMNFAHGDKTIIVTYTPCCLNL